MCLIAQFTQIPIVVKPLKQTMKYEDLIKALLYLHKACWMIKFDIHSAYHFIDIFPPHTDFLGFSRVMEDGTVSYFRFLVLSFGLSSVPYIFTK